MTDTRRNLFKTSLFSAFGLMSAAALSGCRNGGEHKRRVTPFTGITRNPTIPLVAYNQQDQYWYVFVWVEGEGNGYQVWKTTEAATIPILSSAQVLDTYTWFTNLKSKTQVKQGFQLSNAGIAKVPLDFTGDYLNSPSAILLDNLANKQASSQSMATWNEIGKK